MSVDTLSLELKDQAVRLWTRCGQNSHVAAAIVKADRTRTMDERQTLLDHLATLHKLYNP